MKLPNGYGGITKLSGKRRRPWRVRKTLGFENNYENQKSKQLYQTIGYFATKQEALQALADYNKDPYDLEISTITFEEVYEKWSEKKYIVKDDSHPNGISVSNINGYKAAYLICEKLYKMKFVDIKLDHLQSVVDESGKNTPTLKKLKTLLNQMYNYAVMHEIISKDRDMTEYIDISKAGNPKSIKRAPFKKKEIAKVWEWLKTNEYISVILMLIYSGVRISELLDLKKENVNLKEKWFDVIESKTEAGIRKVPIADKTLPLFEKWMNKNNCEYVLSTTEGEHFEYRNYYDSYWTPLIESMGMTHKPHDTRHTCVSLLTAAGVDERVIKLIVGHKGQGVTQQVYTHLEIDELLAAINKI